MRHLSAIVQIAALAVLDPRQILRLAAWLLSLSVTITRGTYPQVLQQLSEEPRGRGGAAPALDQNVEDISILVDCAPKIVLLAADPDEHLVHVPLAALSTVGSGAIMIAFGEGERPLTVVAAPASRKV